MLEVGKRYAIQLKGDPKIYFYEFQGSRRGLYWFKDERGTDHLLGNPEILVREVYDTESAKGIIYGKEWVLKYKKPQT